MNSSKPHTAINDRVRTSGFCCNRFWKAAATPALALALFSVLALAAGQPAQAQTLTTLYSFTGGIDGANPGGGMVFDPQGNLYGVTGAGGAHGNGTVFEITAAGVEKVLYSFAGGADGSEPNGDLIRDAQGNLYGTTYSGGAYNYGTVFQVTPSGVETVLYSFTGGNDGAYPKGALVSDAQGSLYGCTVNTLFKLTASGVFSVVYTFPPLRNGTGQGPNGGLVIDSQGNLYGTTMDGGPLGSCPHHTSVGCGTVFKVSPDGTETVILNLQSIGVTWPAAGLIVDAQGNFYGTGTQPPHGTVFEVTSTGTGVLLARFHSQKVGNDPQSRLLRDAMGNLYGTAWKGGSDGQGTVFEITASGTKDLLYAFNPRKHPGVGANPSGGLVFDAQGNLYGMTAGGGIYGHGTVYKLTP
jgi:uncharacterized repeat protein (TIGR03803 family)